MHKCNICGKEFNSKLALGGHKGSHSRYKGMILNPIINIKKCKYCQNNYKFKNEIFAGHNLFCSKTCKFKYIKIFTNYDISKNVKLFNEIIIPKEKYNELINNASIKECEICGKKDNNKSLAIDHCHNSLKIRGFLCSHCNRKLGWYEKNRQNINNYLNK